jgi:deoxyribonuclease-1-like protein
MAVAAQTARIWRQLLAAVILVGGMLLPVRLQAAASRPADTVVIASFNIQVFGTSKLAKPHVVDVLSKVVRNFDVVAIQEVRAKSNDVIPSFVKQVNADGSRYQYVIGPRLGRTVSKEQYTFLYDTSRIEVDTTSVGTMHDPGDRLHRPPMFVRFRARTQPAEQGFTFWMMNSHTDPDEVPEEVDALADAFAALKLARPDEDDIILLGDLNASPQQFGRLRQLPDINWAVSGTTTNTRRSKTYDNLIFQRTATAEYTGKWGVLDLQTTYSLSLKQALEVSDHNPVWAAFSATEARPAASGGGREPPASPTLIPANSGATR